MGPISLLTGAQIEKRRLRPTDTAKRLKIGSIRAPSARAQLLWRVECRGCGDLRGDDRYAPLLQARDDWARAPRRHRINDLVEILEQRYGRRSTMITSRILPRRMARHPQSDARRINLSSHILRRSRDRKHPRIDRDHSQMQKIIDTRAGTSSRNALLRRIPHVSYIL